MIDQNSIWLSGNSRGIGFWSEAAASVCYRSNIIWGSGFSTGLQLDGITLSATCPMAPSNDNVARNHLVTCTGNQCAGNCAGAVNPTGPMCNLTTDPGYSLATNAERPFLCLRPAPGNLLIDAGPNLGYHMIDNSTALFNGAAPDIGARESGATRAFGGAPSICP